MNARDYLRIGEIISFSLVIAIMVSLGCSDTGKSSNSSHNQAPSVPTAVTPVNGATDVPRNFTLEWAASDPDNDPVSFDLHFGPDSVASHSGAWMTASDYASPWFRQSMARELLGQIYQMQMAYSRTLWPQWGFCLNGASTHAGDSTFFGLLGAVPELTDPYTYEMTASTEAFTCVASANIDGDADNDIWQVNQGFLGDTLPSCITNDFDFAYRINTTYYWQVDVRDDHGNRTSGPLWHFTTGSDTTGTNAYPSIPNLISPPDGGLVALDTLIFSWECSDPDGDSVEYRLYLGNSPDFQWPGIRNHIHRTFQPSPWMMRAKGCALLSQIYVLQTAYHGQYGSYCLNYQTASYGYDGFAPLGVIVDSLNSYTYCMSSARDVFVCVATATDLDNDATTDVWQIDQDSNLVCLIDDFVLLRAPNSVYYWRISARDIFGHTSLSAIRQFATPE